MKLRALAAFVLVLLGAASVERVSVALSQSGPQAVSKDKETPAPAPPVTTAETPALLVDDKHVESILGKQIISSSGETLGNVTDILVDSQGRVRAAIVDFGGFLGVGVRKLAVAWTALHFVQGKTALTAVLDMDKDQLRVAPEYRAGEPIVIVGAGQKPASSPSPSAK